MSQICPLVLARAQHSVPDLFWIDVFSFALPVQCAFFSCDTLRFWQHLAVLRRDDEMALLLLQVKQRTLRADNLSSSSFSPPLTLACSSLLQSGADAFIADRDGQNAVNLATKRQRTALFGNMDRCEIALHLHRINGLFGFCRGRAAHSHVAASAAIPC
jgi:hypothetical protein